MNETAIREHFQEQEKIRENIAKITVMELNKIVVKKYFDGETSVEEEKSCKTASHLMQYKSILDILLCCCEVQTRTCSVAKAAV
jgi:phosphoribosylpyrophosphate synthetase